MAEHEDPLHALVDFLGEEIAQLEKKRRAEMLDLRIEVADLKVELASTNVEIARLKAGPITEVEQMLKRFEESLNRSLGRPPILVAPIIKRDIH